MYAIVAKQIGINPTDLILKISNLNLIGNIILKSILL